MTIFKLKPSWIIALLCAVSLNATSHASSSRLVKAKQDLKALEFVLERFKSDFSRYPTTEEGLKALVTPTPELLETGKYPKSGYLDRLPRDPWNSEYQYLIPGKRGAKEYDLWSLGADGKPGGSASDADIWPETPEDVLNDNLTAIMFALLVGSAFGLVMGLPIYITGFSLQLRKGLSAREAATGFHLGVLIYLILFSIAATLVPMFFARVF